MDDITKATFEDRDEFKRKPIAENFIKILNSNIDLSLVSYNRKSLFVINGIAGTGKTEFCHKLMNLIRQDNKKHIVYVDAFKADHTNEPLFAVLAAIINILPKNKLQKFKKSCLPVLCNTAKYFVERVVSISDYAPTLKTAKDLKEVYTKSVAKSTYDLVEQRLNASITSEKDLSLLKKSLTEITATKPITIFIDELDRCKPDFALHMLEIIKHVFDGEGIKFVMLVNLEQLKAFVKKSYGASVDADRYLDKFIIRTFTLPQLTQNNHASFNHYKELIAQDENLSKSDLGIMHSIYEELVKKIIGVHDLSLREIETLIYHLKEYQMLCPNCFQKDTFNSRSCKTAMELFTIILFCFNKNILKDLVYNTVNIQDLKYFLGIENTETDSKLIEEIFISIKTEYEKSSEMHNKNNKEENTEKYLEFYYPFEYEERPYMAIIRSIFNKLNLLVE
jgi:hypothetical protein